LAVSQTWTARFRLAMFLAVYALLIDGAPAAAPGPSPAEHEARLLALPQTQDPISHEDWTALHALCAQRSDERDYRRLTACAHAIEATAALAPSEDQLLPASHWMRVTNFPIQPKVMLMRAQAHLDCGEYAEAIDIASRAVELGERVRNHLSLLDWHLQAHKAFVMRTEALLAIAYHHVEDAANSRRHLRLLERSDTTEEKFAWLAQVAMATGRDGEALAAFDQYREWAADQKKTAIVDIIGILVGVAINRPTGAGRNLPSAYPRSLADETWRSLLSTNVAKNLQTFQQGHLHLNVGRLTEAHASLEKLLQSPDAGLMGSIYWAALYDMGRLAEAEQRHDAAIGYYHRSMEALERVRSRINSAASRIGFIGNRQAVYRSLMDLLLRSGQARDAFIVAEHAKARVTVEMLAEKQDFRRGDEDDAPLADLLSRQAGADLIRVSDGLAAEAPVPTDAPEEGRVEASARRALHSAVSDGDDARRTLQEKFPAVAMLVGVVNADPTAIQSSLRDDEVLLSYYYTPSRLVAFVVDKHRLNAVGLPREGLELEIQALQQALSMPSGDYGEAAAAAYHRLIAPLQDQLANRTLVISPYDQLHFVPFGALLDGSTFLSERSRIVYLPSGSFLPILRGRARTSARQGVLALGDPGGKLRFARQEAEQVASAFDTSVLLIGQAATKSRVVEHSGRFRYLHFATHGVFNLSHPLKSGLLLSAGDSGAEAEPAPMLTTGDVYGLRLDADLVVLSACQSGIGTLRSGDEVVGLARAFLYAGARRVVSTGWSVEDQTTARLMKYFYASLKVGAAADEALRDATIRLRSEGWVHPFYWAAFTIVGVP